MSYQAKNYDRLLGATGLSDQLLKNHFTLYQGYVTNTNKLSDKLATMLKEGDTETPEYAELKRRFGWEWNGMRLHEHYFDNMVKGGNPLETDSPLSKKLAEEFGSYEDWEKDFKATGSTRGIGWTALYLDPLSKRLFNTWINEHDVGHLSGCTLLLIMDVFEHAFMIDYGLKRAGYIEAFFQNIDWKVVSSRFTG
ncbi:MAG: superoxide dismutase [Nitrososphaerales archaeon]